MGPITRIAAGIREREYCSTLERSGSGPCSGDGSADGVYLGEHLLAFDFISNVFAYPDLPGWSQPPTVMLSAGKVASVSVHGDGDNSFFDIRGFDAFFHQGEQHADLITATGTLVPVPEPDTDALLLAGLALVGIVVPRRRSAVSRRDAAS